MGRNVIEHGYVKAKGKLKGTRVAMDVVTVGGTENLLMAATGGRTTVLKNCAIEPEVVDLAECLVKMGAENQRHRNIDHDQEVWWTSCTAA